MTSMPEITPENTIENEEDERAILADSDQTFTNPGLSDDNQFSAGRLAQNLEDEPAEFMRGEVDVLEQMRRTSRAADLAFAGHNNLDTPDVPTGGLDALTERPEGILQNIRDRVIIPDTGEEITLPVEMLDELADEDTLSLGELGETSLEAARASGYGEENEESLDQESDEFLLDKADEDEDDEDFVTESELRRRTS